ncbi:MAG TPA: C13 family peptidase [Vicinamibacterales bacterium]
MPNVFLRLVVTLAVLCAPVAASAQATHLLIVVGLAGDPEHGELFRKWGSKLVDAATTKLGVPKENVAYLSDEDTPVAPATGRSTREEVAKAFAALASKAGEDDTVMIVLFGHGTFDGKIAKFNLPGPDMSPADFAPLLAHLRSKRIVFVDTASASGPFVEALSGPGRIVLAATRTGAEKFATLFGGPFVDAFSTEAADTDRNGRVSVLEAFSYAKQQVAAEYQREGLLQTEHALLDDNGDKEGSMDPGPQAKDGQAAAALSLGAARAEAAPANEQLRALYAERDALERRIESLKLLKSGMDPDKYAAELEKLATELALKGRQIREAEGKVK